MIWRKTRHSSLTSIIQYCTESHSEYNEARIRYKKDESLVEDGGRKDVEIIFLPKDT